jgi:16S rRNA (cytidine1402-2'-O)-methyltransferase
MPGTLYVLGTPIGNLSDFSPRGLETLRACDFIAAEDTRVTVKLLNHFGIKKPQTPYHEHNRKTCGPEILARILAGESCALVTDAGMPAISDPGEELVSACHAQGVPVRAVPGPTAFATALAVSGMDTRRFTFEGFLSVNKASRRTHLASLVHERRTMVFYEAPHKFLDTLRDLYNTLGNRRIAAVREITKIYEEVVRTTLLEALTYFENGVKGELVLIVEGAQEPERPMPTLEEAAALARQKMNEGLSASDAAKDAAGQTGLKKGEIYKRMIE